MFLESLVVEVVNFGVAVDRAYKHACSSELFRVRKPGKRTSYHSDINVIVSCTSFTSSNSTWA